MTEFSYLSEFCIRLRSGHLEKYIPTKVFVPNISPRPLIKRLRIPAVDDIGIRCDSAFYHLSPIEVHAAILKSSLCARIRFFSVSDRGGQRSRPRSCCGVSDKPLETIVGQ